MDRRLPSVALALSAVLTACSPPAVDVEAEGEVLMQLSREWSDLVATGDMDAIMAGWAEDAVMMPPGTPPLEGKAAIRAYVEAGQQLPGFEISWEPMTVHVAASGDMAYMIERNVTSAHDTLGEPRHDALEGGHCHAGGWAPRARPWDGKEDHPDLSRGGAHTVHADLARFGVPAHRYGPGPSSGVRGRGQVGTSWASGQQANSPDGAGGDAQRVSRGRGEGIRRTRGGR